jgi:hypothetical protein
MKRIPTPEEYQREWIEFGKMFDAIGNKASLISDGKGKFAVIDSMFTKTYEENEYVDISIKVQTTDYEWFYSPLEALKFYYFSTHLGIDTEYINLDFNPQGWATITRIADEEFITIDEVVARILKEYLEDEHTCCGCGCL